MAAPEPVKADESKNKSTIGSEAEAEDDVVDWKKLGTLASESQPIRRRRKLRQIPDYYFLPRKSLPNAILYYGAYVIAGIGAGMLVEKWIKKKVAEDGGMIWEKSSSEKSRN
ncbi:hypothetical protein SUGI_0238440 [Cryptomeria japonica]|uniref:uncharacterized protein LOC131053346 n=1 Tax=Cryptomeria japonica TaxID=3369 RepID=UPI002408B293|nr:uncharacterized protein LOC131053346 [Cryptomeria japonica]GLJ14710.1 hypothetical protein SUGI_0238440 [Cryptomeria japonica]